LRFRSLGPACAAFACCVSLSSAGFAQSENRGRTAAAEALYLEGRSRMEEGAFDRGCPKLEASLELERGLGTLLLLAHCYEMIGRTASAWALFQDARALALADGEDERAEVARVRAEALSGKLSRLRIHRSARAPRALGVRRDGVPMPAESLDVALPVDPGEHRIEVTAKGYEPQSLRVLIRAGEPLTSVTLPELRPSPKRATPRNSPDAAAQAEGAAPARVLAYTSGALGAAGVVLGATYGLMARAEYQRSLDHCRTESLCSQRGLALRDGAEGDAQIATISFAAGGGLLATSLVLFLVAPSDGPSEHTIALSVPLLRLEPRGGSVAWEGTF
jgi:hypothetical protein